MQANGAPARYVHNGIPIIVTVEPSSLLNFIKSSDEPLVDDADIMVVRHCGSVALATADPAHASQADHAASDCSSSATSCSVHAIPSMTSSLIGKGRPTQARLSMSSMPK